MPPPVLATQITKFLFNLKLHSLPPNAIETLFPFADEATKQACRAFYGKYYSDNRPRYCIIGINPGRFGGGVTGIPFTDPIRLQQECGIGNTWQKKQELSSVFVYEVIKAFGGPKAFYSKFYITSVSPLGFTKDGKNLNYYDDKELIQTIRPFAVDCLQQQLNWGLHRTTAFCFGDGKNFKFLSQLNKEHGFFEQIIPLSHPRFIMQYKLKQKELYIEKYLEAFSTVTI
ncbi:MAG: uracil-DNA glycosylase family protein [Chitinophagaceae bacterium]